MKYRAEVDGLRALAVVPVILFHADFSLFSGGFVGVDIFFVISGYLITTILINDLDKDQFSIAKFYERRARRILPAMFFVMLVCLPFAWYWMYPNKIIDFSESLIAVSVFLSNILFSHGPDYFDAAVETKPLLHTWSLAVEEQYYLTFPVFLLLMWKYGKNAVFWMIVIFAVLSLISSEWGSRYKPDDNFYFGPTRAWELYAGSIAAFIINKHGIRSNNLLSLIGLCAILFSIFVFNKNTPSPSLYTFMPVLGVVLIVLFGDKETYVARILSNKILVGIGLISYSAYLWHQPIFAFFRISEIASRTDLLMFALTSLSFILAVLSWRFVEQPFRNPKNFSRKQIFGISIFASGFFILLGILVIKNDGDLGRWPSTVVQYDVLDAQASEFVWTRKKKLRKVKFDTSKVKLLIVGDSNSADLLNVIEANSNAGKFSISTLRIDAGCGNIYLERASYSKLMKISKRNGCRGIDGLKEPHSRAMLKNADWVMFASSWREWEATILQKSHASLVEVYGEKFLYFGNKHTTFDADDYIHKHKDLVWPKTSPPLLKSTKINAEIHEAVGAAFIDPYQYFCDNNECNTFTDEGEIIQNDSFHLTIAGAKFFGAKFDPVMKILLAPKE